MRKDIAIAKIFIQNLADYCIRKEMANSVGLTMMIDHIHEHQNVPIVYGHTLAVKRNSQK